MKKISFLILIILTIFSCKEPTARKPITYSSSNFISKSVKTNKLINSIQKKAIEFYISQDSVGKYLTSPYGFWYKYIIKNDDTEYKPQFGDEVEFEYNIYGLNNKIIYSTNDLGKVTHIIDKEDIEYGIQHGLKLMSEGEQVKFILPSYAAFGYVGDQSKIGLNQPLIYNIKLIKINRRNENS